MPKAVAGYSTMTGPRSSRPGSTDLDMVSFVARDAVVSSSNGAIDDSAVGPWTDGAVVRVLVSGVVIEELEATLISDEVIRCSVWFERVFDQDAAASTFREEDQGRDGERTVYESELIIMPEMKSSVKFARALLGCADSDEKANSELQVETGTETAVDLAAESGTWVRLKKSGILVDSEELVALLLCCGPNHAEDSN